MMHLVRSDYEMWCGLTVKDYYTYSVQNVDCLTCLKWRAYRVEKKLAKDPYIEDTWMHHPNLQEGLRNSLCGLESVTYLRTGLDVDCPACIYRLRLQDHQHREQLKAKAAKEQANKAEQKLIRPRASWRF